MLVRLTCLARTLVEVTRVFMSSQLSVNNQPVYLMYVVYVLCINV